MQYTHEFDEQDKICKVKVTGENRRPQDSLTLQRFAYDFNIETGCFQFLFDMTDAIIIGDTMDAYKVGTGPQHIGFKIHGPHRIAIVYKGDLSKHKFMENVAVNRGYNLRIFSNLIFAEKWLNNENGYDNSNNPMIKTTRNHIGFSSTV